MFSTRFKLASQKPWITKAKWFQNEFWTLFAWVSKAHLINDLSSKNQFDHAKLHSPLSSVTPSFKNKTRYTPYVSPGSQISHIATNKGNIKRQCSIYNVLSIKDITLNSNQRNRSSDKDSNSTGTTDWFITSLIPPNSSNLVPIRDFPKI